MTVSDLPAEDSLLDAKNHTHEWKLTWGLAFSDWRADGPASLLTRYKHTGRHSHGVAKGILLAGLGQWKARAVWKKKWLKSLYYERSQLLRAIERLGHTKAVWCS